MIRRKVEFGNRECAYCSKEYVYHHHLQDKDYCSFICHTKDKSRGYMFLTKKLIKDCTKP